MISSPDVNASTLSVNITSDNNSLLPSSSAQGNWIVNRGTATAGFPSTQPNTLSLFPVGVKGGSADITITVSDGQSTPATTTFLLFVQGPGSPIAYNPTIISFGGADANGSPYPSPTVPAPVSGLVGKVENVVVTVYDVSYNNAGGLNLLLVGPTAAAGQNPAVYLMSAAAPVTAANSVNLTFSNSLPGAVDNGNIPLPKTAVALSSTAIYTPTNYNTAPNGYTTAAPTPAPLPTGTGYTMYGNNLAAVYKGINPNGTWSLYAFDTSGGMTKPGNINGGWQLSIITAPNVSPSASSYSTLENVPITIDVPIGDAEPENSALVVTASVAASGFSTVPTVTVANSTGLPVVNNGTINEAVLTINPIAYQFGTNIITISASDAATAGTPSIGTITVIVTSNSQPPVVEGPVASATSGPGPFTLSTNTPAGVALTNHTALQFSVWDAQTTNQSQFTITATSGVANQGIIPDSNISVTFSNVVSGTNNYVLSIAPAGVQSSATPVPVTLTIVDSVGQKLNETFNITITPNLAFSSSGSLALGPGSPVPPPSNPYPWPITVPNSVVGLVSGVQVALQGVTMGNADDLDVLLVAPDGKTSCVLMANVGGANAAENLDLEFSEIPVNGVSPSSLPTSSALSSGVFLPDNNATSLVFSNASPPAPTTPANPQNLNVFAQQQVTPSGTWNLYVMDTGKTLFPDNGSIGSWQLFLQTGPAIAPIPTNGVLENGSVTIPITLTDSSTAISNLTVTVTSSTYNGLTLTKSTTPLAVTETGAATSTGVTALVFTPAANFPSAGTTLAAVAPTNSTNSITVTVSDTSGNMAQQSFTLIVTNANQPAGVSASPTSVTMNESSSVPNGTGLTTSTITFTVSDPDSYLADTNITLTSSNPSILTNKGIAVMADSVGLSLTPGTAGSITYKITPVGNTFGTGNLVFSVTDTNGNTTVSNVPLTITQVIQPPTISSFFSGVYTLNPGTTSTNIPFSIATTEPNATLTVTATAGAYTGGGYSTFPANINVTPSSFSQPGGSGTITVTPIGAPTAPERDTVTITVTQIEGNMYR